MEYRRYGKFQFSDYWSIWVGAVVMIFFAVSSFALGTPPFLAIFPGCIAVFWTLSVMLPYRERFSLLKDRIIVIIGRKRSEVQLPYNPTFIVTPAYSKLLEIDYRTIPLKNKYAVSVLMPAPLDFVLKQLHQQFLPHYRTYIRSCMYCNKTVEEIFNYQFLYSFVCDQKLLDQLLLDRKCRVIIPRSVSGVFTVNDSNAEVYIDMEY